MPEAHVAMQTVTGPVGIRGLLQPVLGSGARIYAPQALSLILAGCLHLVSPASVPQSTLPWRAGPPVQPIETGAGRRRQSGKGHCGGE
jgi:hypothetical protein